MLYGEIKLASAQAEKTKASTTFIDPILDSGILSQIIENVFSQKGGRNE